ncbi:ASCH domain-containing protein [Nonomuraea recticatena]|uniref:ASCH domain-containing protein n=1 Tax=Nonomuraea recticatena TaxID=46178 RepID=UPI003620115D
MWGRIEGLRVLGLGTPGGLRAELNGLVLSGAKTGTAGLLEHDYRAEGEELERAGERLALVDDDDQPIAVIEVTAVEVVPFGEVTWEFADSEGRGTARWNTGPTPTAAFGTAWDTPSTPPQRSSACPSAWSNLRSSRTRPR